MDTGNPNIPVIILGDLNTSLPQMGFLTQRWFTKRPFNRNSVLLYNFIEENNFCVANFICEQNTNYTFSKGSLTSYIDHILIRDGRYNRYIGILRFCEKTIRTAIRFLQHRYIGNFRKSLFISVDSLRKGSCHVFVGYLSWNRRYINI